MYQTMSDRFDMPLLHPASHSHLRDNGLRRFSSPQTFQWRRKLLHIMGSSTSKALPLKRLDGKTAVVTGSNTGIGKVTAKELYKLGARVIMACRDPSRANAAIEDIQNSTKEQKDVGELVFKELNLSSLASVRNCANDINSTEKEIHYLINNAGVFLTPRMKTDDGFEQQFGVNHLGHFLFTCLLLPKLIKSAPSKIINVSSVAHEKGKIDFDDVNFEKRPYHPTTAYYQSKLANVLFARHLANKLQGTGVTAFSLHPGIIKTELGRYLDDAYFRGARLLARLTFGPFSLTPEEGAKTTLYTVLADNENENGSYYSNCQLHEPAPAAKSDEDAQRLWDLSCKLVNIEHDPFSSS